MGGGVCKFPLSRETVMGDFGPITFPQPDLPQMVVMRKSEEGNRERAKGDTLSSLEERQDKDVTRRTYAPKTLQQSCTVTHGLLRGRAHNAQP